jgi:hypothetical protein
MKRTSVDKTTGGRTHFKELVDTSYLGQWSLPPGKDQVVLITKVERYEPARKRTVRLADGTEADEPSKRLCIHFQGVKKPWLAGPVSLNAIANLYGPIVQAWIGRAITLYVDPNVKMGKQTTGGLRVRPQIPHSAPTQDALDRPADPEAVARIEAAKEALREPGEDRQ